MNEKKRKISTCVYVHSILHHWACILILEGRVIEYVCWWELVCELFEIFFFLCIHFVVYIDVWGSLHWVCLLMRVRMWAFRDPPFFCICCIVYFESETGDLFLRAPGHCLFHHYIHCSCDFTSCWIWADPHCSCVICLTIILVFAFDSSSSFHPLFMPYNDLFRVWYFLYIILTHLIISLICFIVSLLILYSHWVPLGP